MEREVRVTKLASVSCSAGICRLVGIGFYVAHKGLFPIGGRILGPPSQGFPEFNGGA